MGVGCTSVDGSCPDWILETMTYWDGANNKYLINDNEESYQNQIYGYWLLSSANSGAAYCMRNVGYIGSCTTYNSSNGIRPVITVPKSYLES